MKRVLIITAHPDDAELGMGMKIKSHTMKGDIVKLVIVTNGEYKDSPNGRVIEAVNSAKILGVKRLIFLNFPCARLNRKEDEIRIKFEKIIKEEQPDIVYTSFKNDLHVDHEIVSQQVLIAARSIPILIMFRVAHSRYFYPNLFFAGEDSLMKFKLKALSCYKDEVQKRGTIDLAAIEALSEHEIKRYLHHSLVLKIGKTLNLRKGDKAYFEMFFIEKLTSF